MTSKSLIIAENIRIQYVLTDKKGQCKTQHGYIKEIFNASSSVVIIPEDKEYLPLLDDKYHIILYKDLKVATSRDVSIVFDTILSYYIPEENREKAREEYHKNDGWNSPEKCWVNVANIAQKYVSPEHIESARKFYCGEL